jgi:CheY-like chemotaxis protein
MIHKTERRKQLHVLVVDSDHTKRSLVRNALHEHDVDCTTCANGLDGVRSFENNNYDGIIIDYNKPNTRTSFVRALLENNKQNIPILLYDDGLTDFSDDPFFVLTPNKIQNKKGTITTFIELMRLRRKEGYTC